MTGQPEPTIHDAPATGEERPDVPKPPHPPTAVEIERKKSTRPSRSRCPASNPQGVDARHPLNLRRPPLTSLRGPVRSRGLDR